MNELLEPKKKRRSFLRALRTYFLTGLVVTAPIYITFYLALWFVEFLDNYFRPLIPEIYWPTTYFPVDVPGVGLVLALILLTVIGGLTANFLGQFLLRASDQLIRKIPMAGALYTMLKQVFQTAVSEDGSAFQDVALIEYPRKGLHAIAFVTKAADPRINSATGKKMIGVFLPTTPNPTSGFLLFVPEDELTILDMTVEDGARMVISAGIANEEPALSA
ncbi:MAG: DUF502 domain-containing protein [Rhodobiaceae bacterium]|jgi:uncharacterized membrane protein|nr:DUF502 domain-containing protein [Rhodobiaceae bacterium]